MGCCCSTTLCDLVKACENGTALEIEAALLNGFDINSCDGENITPHNVLGGLFPSLTHWWKNDGRYFQGMTALCVAIYCGRDLEIIKLLLSKGADANLCGKAGMYCFHSKTPVQWACSYKQKVLDSVALLELLFEAGASVSSLDTKPTADIFSHHESALRLAIKAKDYKCVDYLIQVRGMNVNDNSFRNAVAECDATILMTAVDVYDYDLAQLEHLIQLGADVQLLGAHGMTALFACRNRPFAEMLVAHGIAIDQKDDRGLTALHYITTTKSLDHKHFALCLYLISMGADIYNKNNLEVGMLDKLNYKQLEDYQIEYTKYREKLGLSAVSNPAGGSLGNSAVPSDALPAAAGGGGDLRKALIVE